MLTKALPVGQREALDDVQEPARKDGPVRFGVCMAPPAAAPLARGLRKGLKREERIQRNAMISAWLRLGAYAIGVEIPPTTYHMSHPSLVLVALTILVFGTWVWLNIAGLAQSRQLRGRLAFWIRVRAMAGLSAAAFIVVIASDSGFIALMLVKLGAIVGALVSGAIFMLALIRVIQLEVQDLAATCTAAVGTLPTTANGGTSCSIP